MRYVCERMLLLLPKSKTPRELRSILQPKNYEEGRYYKKRKEEAFQLYRPPAMKQFKFCFQSLQPQMLSLESCVNEEDLIFYAMAVKFETWSSTSILSWCSRYCLNEGQFMYLGMYYILKIIITIIIMSLGCIDLSGITKRSKIPAIKNNRNFHWLSFQVSFQKEDELDR